MSNVNADWSNRLTDPPADYRTAPFWVWNEEIDETAIAEQLRLLKDNGFGGAFVHPRPGLITEYLSDRWFELWAYALAEAKRLSLKLYIYDENSYPSGFAGGHVPSRLPDLPARAAVVRFYNRVEDPSALFEDPWIPEASLKRPIRIYPYSREGGQLKLGPDLTVVPDVRWKEYGDSFVALLWQEPERTPWLGGFAYPDLLRPEVVELFLETTYEAYYRRFGADFGAAIPAIFTDEPAISPGNVFIEGGDMLPFSYWFAAQFMELNGYSLTDRLIWLFADPDEETAASMEVPAEKIRFDYYSTLHRLWTQNFLQPMSSWCERRHIAWTGHFMEHHWPYPWGQCSPAVMSYYEYMRWPGIDMLMSHLLRTSNSDPLLLTIKEAQSAASQLGKERVLCEVHGAGGWDTTLEDMKRMGDWLAVNGVTFFNQHLVFSSIVGARKRDHPLSFDWRQPWWGDYRKLNDYWARLGYALSQGRTEHRVLVLHPTVSYFIRKPSDGQGNMMWEWEHVPEGSPFRSYVELLQLLTDHQIGYDLGDEFIMERHGSVEGDGRLRIGQCVYDVVLMPEAMSVMRRSTLELLNAYVARGGKLLRLGALPERIDGVRSAETDVLAVGSGSRPVQRGALAAELRELIPEAAALEVLDGDGSGVALLRRRLGDGAGDLWFVVNSNAGSVRIRLYPGGGRIRTLDLFTGEPGRCTKLDAASPYYEAELPACGSLLLEWTASQGEAPDRREGGRAHLYPAAERFVLQPDSIELLSGNVLMLDYCDLLLGGRTYAGLHTLAATDRIYKHHGLPANPWDRVIQFKDSTMRRSACAFAPNSGFEASFTVETAEGFCPTECLLAVERAEMYSLFVNGTELPWLPGRHWLDKRTGLADIAGALQPGRNVIRLVASPFHIVMELEPVYLLGGFAVASDGERFRLAEVEQLKLGSIAEQGCPFYGENIRYSHTLRLADKSGRRLLRLNGWSGTVCRVSVNGVDAGLLGVGTGSCLELTSYLVAGDNQLIVEIAASLKNTLGPHHDPSRPRRRAWPAHWKIAPQAGPPRADSYDFIDYGLLEPIAIELAD